MITLEVRRREFLTPGFASITLKGPALRDLILADNDQAVRLFFPRGAQTALRMPTISTGLGTQRWVDGRRASVARAAAGSAARAPTVPARGRTLDHLRCACRAGCCRAVVAKPPADPGGGETAGFGGPFPGATEVLGRGLPRHRQLRNRTRRMTPRARNGGNNPDLVRCRHAYQARNPHRQGARDPPAHRCGRCAADVRVWCGGHHR
ncbi:siderophore-interacting protein [Streptomyces malaysiensis]|uniref:siderophore-interacting protein n=1 Tax=Streptomyces malaysiensis TaxID=92644 RepID=UPI003D2F6CF0